MNTWFRTLAHLLVLCILAIEVAPSQPRVPRKEQTHYSEPATKRAKNAGLKVAYHMMPGLPGSGKEKDLESFKKMIGDERFKPDMLKIYSTLVVKGTELYEQWLAGDYAPMSLDDTVDLLTEVKKIIPPWMRILRIQRDIPAKLIEDRGPEESSPGARHEEAQGIWSSV